MKQDIRLNGKMERYLRVPVVPVILLAAMDVCLYFFDIITGLAGSACVVLYLLIAVLFYRRKRKIVFNDLVDFAAQYESVQKQLLDQLEIPYALTDSTGKLIWMNQAFASLTGKSPQYHKSVSTIFPKVTRESIEKNDDQDMLIERDERILHVSVKKVRFKETFPDAEQKEPGGSEYLAAVYIYDETVLQTYVRENEDMQLVAVMAYIDNYDEVMESVEEVRQSLLVALVDRKVTRYFERYDALIKKTEKDKYFIVFRQKYLAGIEADKYSILEDVKSIKAGNETALTLSIGVGSGCKDYVKNYEYARTAIELALGRGGDQVVRKTMDEMVYFGGNRRQVDRNTRVKARVKALALRELMLSREKFYVMGHSLCDVDAFGAAVGIYCAGRQLGKKVQIVIDEVTTSLRPVKDNFTPENGYPEDLFISSKQALEEYDYDTALIVVDTNRPSYTECPQLLNKIKTIVVFDHHRQNKDVIKNAALSYIEPYASSACEMIAEVLQYFDEDIKLSPAEADSIYAGILIDTNNFMTKTGVRTFEAAAYLRRCGAEVTRVRKMMRNDMMAYKARADAVRHAQVYMDRFAISVCPADNIESPTIACAQAANELLNVIGIKASFVLTEYAGKIYISARSIDEINVQRIMERLGGGGHMNTAGAQMTNCSIEEALRTIKNTLDEMMREGDIKP